VFIEVEPWIFEERPVEIAYQEGNEAIIKSGLKAGDRVAVKGAVLLNDWTGLSATPSRSAWSWR